MNTLIVIGYVILALITLYFVLDITWRIYIRRYPVLPCPFPIIPWLGSLPYYKKDLHELYLQMIELAKKYNFQPFITYLGIRPKVQLGQPKELQDLFQSTDIMKKSDIYDLIKEWLGDGLLFSTGKKWKTRRKRITPTFHFSILNNFSQVFFKRGNTLVGYLKKVAKDEKIIDIQPVMRATALDIICETAMGVELNSLTGESRYRSSVEYVLNCYLTRIFQPWFWPKWTYMLSSTGREYFKRLKELHQFTLDVIEKRINMRQYTDNSCDNNKKVFLDMLLNLYDKGEIDIQGIREEVDTFMFEGHDTTGATLSWIFYYLGKYPEVQKKLQSEIDAAEKKDKPLLERVNSVKYVEHIIKETLRLDATVPAFERVLEKDATIGSLQLKSGMVVTVIPWMVHRNPKYWKNPDEFLPERFADDEYLKQNPYIFIPFSLGPRNCIGQKFAMLEMKVIVYLVMLNFNLLSTQSDNEIEGVMSVIHVSRTGLMVKFSDR